MILLRIDFLWGNIISLLGVLVISGLQSMEDNVIERKCCQWCGMDFDVREWDREFYDKIAPTFAGQKFTIPTPRLCPDCRQQHRLSFRNERNLYRNKCALSNKSLVSIFSPDKPYKIYDQKTRWSDERDSLAYWIDYDFSMNFTENFRKLALSVPYMTTTIQESENCDYTNDTWDSKDCYLSARTHYCEQILYSYRSNKSSCCVDCYQVRSSNNLYECYQCKDCSKSQYLSNCINCYDSLFLRDCVNCANCIMCCNLRDKSYYIKNKKYTKDQYEKIVENMNISSYQMIRKLKSYFPEMMKTAIVSNLDIIGSENCTGDQIINCNNCFQSYVMQWSENTRYSYDNNYYKDSSDSYSGWDSQWCYYTTAAKKSFKVISSIRLRECTDAMYSMFCFYCKNIFWCVGLKNKEYCIFNKQYTKEEYELTVAKIISHMQSTGERWEFFNPSLSPFGYNETVANEYYPIDVSQAKAKDFNRSEYNSPDPQANGVLSSDELPDTIADVPDTILNQAIRCTVSGKLFKLVSAELEFYRKHRIPLPRKHPDIRHSDRIALRNPRTLFDRKCAHCSEMMQTTYAPHRTERVYCQKCYQKIVYG